MPMKFSLKDRKRISFPNACCLLFGIVFDLKQFFLDKTLMNNKILVIDDEVDICFLLGSMLKSRSFDVSFANSLSDGLSRLKSTLPAVLFLDLNLPDGSGLEVIARIKELYPDIKIIVISAYDSSKERTIAATEGADLFIGKPFNREIIYNALDKISVTAD